MVKQTIRLPVLITLTALALSACGGGGGDDGDGGDGNNEGNSSIVLPTPVPSTDTVLVGYFLDSAVSNLDYSTETRNGVTGSDGSFEYVSGETVSFSLGDMPLGSAEAGDVVTPQQLAHDNSNVQTNILRLLQSLDKDGDTSNGIELTDAAKAAAVAVDFDQSEADFSIAVANLLANSGLDVSLDSLVDGVTAEGHFSDTLNELITCDTPRDFTLRGVDTVVWSAAEGNPDSVKLYPISGSLNATAHKEFFEGNARDFTITANEGYSGEGYVQFDQTTTLGTLHLVGTIARNNMTLVAPMNISRITDSGLEVVYGALMGEADSPCLPSAIQAGTYTIEGKEAVISESQYEDYPVSGTLTVTDNSCEVSTTEGDWSCTISGNRIQGVGEASPITGTITQYSVTLVMPYVVDGTEAFFGYYTGSRNDSSAL